MVAPRKGSINIPKDQHTMHGKGGTKPEGERKALPTAEKLEPKPNPDGKRATVVE